MRLGLYHTTFLEWDPPRLFDWMAGEGIYDVELHGGPRYRAIDWERVAAGDASLADAAAARGIRIGDIMDGSVNFLAPDPQVRERSIAHTRVLIRAAKVLGAGSVSIFTGRNPDATLEANLDQLPEALRGVLETAEEVNVTLALENCPMAHEWPPRFNIAIHPGMWRHIFERIPSPALGLTFDPSHLVWQGIDVAEAAEAFIDRIAVVQAKDSEVLPGIVRREGILDRHFWRHRIPGQGAVDWPRLVSVLVAGGYDGPLYIEQEDPFFEADADAQIRGIDLTRRYLDPYLAMTRPPSKA